MYRFLPQPIFILEVNKNYFLKKNVKAMWSIHFWNLVSKSTKTKTYQWSELTLYSTFIALQLHWTVAN